jgi:hypothetical protein
MIEVLQPEEIERILSDNFIGRIGCHADARTYVIPIAYAYSMGAVYAHSLEGLKLRIMRKNPLVCFETDSIQDVFNWRSVIAWGTFEELSGAAADEAMRTLLLRFLPTKAQSTVRSLTEDRPGIADDRAVVYRIRLIEKTGRFERSR